MRMGMRSLGSLWPMIALAAACQRRPPPAYPDGTYPQAYAPGYATGAFGGSWVTQGGAMTLQEQNGTVTGTIQRGGLEGTVQGAARGNQLDFLLSMSDGSSGRFTAYSDGNQLTIDTGGPQPLVFVRPGGPPAPVGQPPAAPPAYPPAPPPVQRPSQPPAPPPPAPAPSRSDRSRHADHAAEARGQVGLVTGCFRSQAGSGAVWVERTLYFDGAGRFSKHGFVAGQGTDAGGRFSGTSATLDSRGEGGTYAVTGRRVRLSWNDGTTSTFDLVYDKGQLGALQNGSTWYLRCK